MTRNARHRSRIRVGSRVKVCMDHQRDILSDMNIQGPDGNLLQNIWMHGTVSSISSNYYSVKLSTARTDERCGLRHSLSKGENVGRRRTKPTKYLCCVR